MKQTSPESPGSHITPAQAADVIKFYDELENGESFRNGWQRKIPLGRLAIHTAKLSHSIFPDGQMQLPLLSRVEAADGLAYLQQRHKQQELGSWPVEPTEAQWEEIFILSDKRPLPVDEAYYEVMQVKPLHWK